MRSDFANNKGLSGLAGLNTDNWLINDGINKLRITSSNARTALTPFSIDVQISTSQSEWWLDFSCPDLFVLVRSVNSGSVVASKYVTSHTHLNSCLGRATLVFNQSFSAAQPVQIEIYDDKVETLSQARAAQPKAASQVFTFNQDVYDAPEKSALEKLEGSASNSGILSSFNGILNKVLIVGGVGAGVYFLSPFFPDIKAGFENVADNLKEKMA